MTPPIPYNIPEGKSEQEALPDELLQLLDNVFQGVTSAFGDNATLYRIDVGKIYESVQDGELVFAGQFVDKSDGEIFNFEINQETNQLGYKSSGEILDRQSLADFCGSSSNEEDQDSNEDQSEEEGLRPYNLLLDAINDESSEAGQSPFGSKLRKDLDYLAALSAAMYHGGITIEAQPLYTGLHSYTIKYALSGLQLFTQSIGSMEGLESELMAEQWVDEHGMDFASAVVKEFSSRRSEQMRELIQAGDQAALEETKALVEEAIAMAMACTVDLIKTVAEADDYKQGDVQAAFAAAIDEYCPIDNSEGYHVSENPRQMASEWQQVTEHSGCSEDLSMQALGLPVAEHISANTEQDSAETVSDLQTTKHDNSDLEDPERIFYVNVGEGPSRNWDDCRQFGFLAAGGGRKWSKQLEKIRIGDTVIAYLKGYGYVGIGTVISTAIPANKFSVSGVPIKDLPLINDTIRSIKRFSKENGEYLIGIEWQVAVAREQAAWKPNAGLYTTALVCASLSNQSDTIRFAIENLNNASDPNVRGGQQKYNTSAEDVVIEPVASIHDLVPPTPQQCETTIGWIKGLYSSSLYEDELACSASLPEKVNVSEWASNEEFLNFFRAISIEIAKSALQDPGSARIELFDHEGFYELGPDSPYVRLWERAYATSDPSLGDLVDISDWGNEIVHTEVKELALISLIPLAHAYQFDSFWEQISNGWAASGQMASTQEEFLGQMIAMMAPGYYDGDIPTEITKIASSRILAEIFECWDQYRDLWEPDTIRDVLSSEYANEEVKRLIARVIANEESDSEWESHREDLWSYEEIKEILDLCQ